MRHKIVTIFRGLPGSGKSTLAAQMYKGLADAVVCTSDDFFTTPTGEYVFEPKLLPQAHGECLKKYVQALQENKFSVIAVANTNLSVAEMAPYYALAEAYGAEVEVCTIDCPIELAKARNTHLVPDSTIERMYRILQEEDFRLPPWWNHHYIPAVIA